MKMTIMAFAIISILMLGACATSPQRPTQIKGDNYTYTRDYMRWMINKKMKENDITGLSIALIDNQKIIWAEGFGYADKKNKVKAAPETIYRVGSITKLFTSTAAMQLAEQGRLDIDQPLQHYLPQFSIKSRFEEAGPITPRTIMTHHSGLPSDRINRMWGDETAHFTEVAVVLKDEYSAYPPETILSYSNLGFSLLGHMVEQVSDTPYADYIEQQIFRPAGMKHAYIDANLHDGGQNSKGYFNQEAHATPHLRDVPAGSLNASVVDLAHFARMTFNNGYSNGTQILKPETLRQMQSFQDGDAVFDVNRSVGLAWFLDDRFGDDAGLIALHNGGTLMFFSEFLTLPKHKLAVVVLANSNTAAGVTGEISQQFLKLALESKTGIKINESVKLKQVLPTLAEDLERLPGYWSSPFGLIQVHRHGDRLKIEIDDETLNLVRREDGHYHLQYKFLGLLPIDLGEIEKVGFSYQQIAGREVMTLYLDGQPLTIIAEKAVPQDLPAVWEKYLGRYESINSQGDILLQTVELRYKDGLLQAEYKLKMTPRGEKTSTVILQPVTDSEAVTHGLGRGRGETVKFAENDGEILASYSGFLLRRVE